MIAQRYLVSDDDASAGIRSRSARGAAERRRARTRRLRYAMFARIATVTGILTVCVVVYLGLMANVERMNYELGKVERDRTALVERSAQLEDTLARLRSRERLAHIAMTLGMHEPQLFAAVTVPPVRHDEPPSGLAFLAKLR